MIKLTVYENDSLHSELELDLNEELIAGRSKKTDLVLSHEKISREHCKIYYSAYQWILDDLDSKNGTTINGERIMRQTLVNGDVIEIAHFRIEVYLEEIKLPPDEDVTVVADDREFVLETITSDDRTLPDIRKVAVPPPVDETAKEEIPEKEPAPVSEKTKAIELVAEEPVEEGDEDRIEILEEPAGTSARNCLEVIEGKMQGNVCGFDNHILVGRSQNCDMLILDATVSREHLMITLVKNKCVLTNLNKNNITYLNGKMINKANIRDGDIIKIGETTLKASIFTEKKNIAWEKIIAAVVFILLLAALLVVFLDRQEMVDTTVVNEQSDEAVETWVGAIPVKKQIILPEGDP